MLPLAPRVARWTAIAALAMLAGLVACRPATPPPSALPPTCQRFLARYGGEAVFGPVLRPPQPGESAIYLYAGLLRCPPQGEPAFAPLGETLLAPEARQPEATIAPEIADWVAQHGGEAVFGPPLAPAYYDADHDRWEQVFQRLAVAWSPARPPSFLPLGALACGSTCLHALSFPAVWLPSAFKALPPSLAALFTRIGGYTLSGPLLLPAYTDPTSGQVLYIFRNLVLRLNPADEHAALFPAVTRYRLGRPSPPQPYRDDPNHRFYTVDPTAMLGYRIPLPIVAFFEAHGGLETLCGQPISDPQVATDGYVELWCENIGLYTPQDAWEIRLRPIGERLLAHLQTARHPTPTPTGYRVFVYAPGRARLGEPITWEAQVFAATSATPQPLSGYPVQLALPDIGHYDQQITDAQGHVLFRLTLNDPGLLGRNLRYRACALAPETGEVLACSEEHTLLVWR